VQEEPVQSELFAEQAIVFALAVVDVANQGARDVFQMPTDLMQATGQGVRFDQAVAAKDLASLEFGSRGHPCCVGIFAGRQRVIDDPCFRWDPTHQGEIGFAGSTLGKRLTDPPGAFRSEGEEQHTAGGSIQSVDRQYREAELRAQAGRGDIALGRPAAMDCQARGLVHGHQILIPVQQRQGVGHEPQPISKVVSRTCMIECKLCQAPCCSQIPSGTARTFLHCSRCGLVFVPENEWLDLDAERARYDQHDNTPTNLGYLRFLSEVVAQVEALQVGTGSILDYGCGEQAILAALLRAKGLACIGYDPLYGREQRDGPHALVILCEVIEHLRDLRGELERVGHLLSPGGRVLVRTRPYPGVEAIADWWYSRDTTHINFFGEPALLHAARLAGQNTVTRLAGDMFLWQRM
jgi:hypothetical protein